MGVLFDLALLAAIVAVVLLIYRRGRGRPEPDERPSAFRRRARQAGFDPGAILWPFWFAKLVLTALLPLAALEVTSRVTFVGPSAWWLVPLAVVGFFLPDLWLHFRRRRRMQAIRRALSYFLDLVVSLLHSGLGLEEAFRRAGRQGLDPAHPLALEVNLVDHELEVGKERSEAFDALAERTGVREFQSVAAALRLGLRLGNSVQATLGAQADLLRLQRRETARREISLAPLKTLVPILLCGFPLFAVLVIFPALTEIFALLREIGALF